MNHDQRAAAVERLSERVRRAVERDVQLRGSTAGADRGDLWRERLAEALQQLFEIRFGEPERGAADLAGLAAEDLGRVYERLLCLQPGVAVEPMIRLRRGGLEAVVPASVGDATQQSRTSRGTRIRAVEAIEEGRFFTCAGLERKSTGSYYTPEALVRWLVGRALGPLVGELGSPERPDPAAILRLRVFDPATGTGNFLCEACRVLGDALLGACRSRLRDDPDAVLALPGGQRLADRLVEDEAQAVSHCRWLVATRCLFGVDLDPLALRITKLALRAVCGWQGTSTSALSAHLVSGDSLAGTTPADLDRRPGGPGFDAVVGNPPWEALRPRAKEFFARYDLRILDTPTRRERRRIERRLERDPAVAAARQRYEARLRRQRETYERLYRWQSVEVDGRLTGGDPDQWKLFMERVVQLVRPGGWVAMLVPSAFHTNASATGIRRLYLEAADLQCCHSLHNRQGVFDIHRSFKFDAVVARKDDRGTRSFACSFHVQDPVELGQHPLTYTRRFVERVGGSHLTFPELRSPMDVDIVDACYRGESRLGRACDEQGVQLRSSLHMTNHAHWFTPTSDVLPADGDPRSPVVGGALLKRGYLPLHEGKTFHQFDDRWGSRPRYLVGRDRLGDGAPWLRAAQYYRLAFRGIASSTNERTGIFTVLPPGVLVGNSAPAEAEPWDRPDRAALLLCALCNTHCVDYLIRVRTSANLNLFIVRQTALPSLGGIEALLVHSALRLVCNHEGYSPLWRSQLRGAWREPPATEPSWPVLAGGPARQVVRAAVDAAVARAFGLTRSQYGHVLSTFSHSSWLDGPSVCLAAFDEWGRVGRRAFVRRHDPYADVSLAEGTASGFTDLDPGPVR